MLTAVAVEAQRWEYYLVRKFPSLNQMFDRLFCAAYSALASADLIMCFRDSFSETADRSIDSALRTMNAQNRFTYP